jgi:t-SNARE complex subunit (syntaxin)
MKGISILYAFGLSVKDDWELSIWHKALMDDMNPKEFESACMHLAKNNTKFWQTDNIPAQLLEIVRDYRDASSAKMKAEKRNQLLLAERKADQEALSSWGSDEERLEAVANIKAMVGRVFR